MNNFIAITQYDVLNTNYLVDIMVDGAQKRIYYSTEGLKSSDAKISAEPFENEADAIHTFNIISAQLTARGFLAVSPTRSINTKYIANIRHREGTICIDMVNGETIFPTTESSFAEIVRKLGLYIF